MDALTDSPRFAGNLLYNTYDAIKSGQTEKVLYNWNMKNPGQMWLYNTDDAAHEFGHMLGLGDAYGAFYRDNKEADNDYETTDLYGKTVHFFVPYETKKDENDSDIMRGGLAGKNRVSNTDMMLLSRIWQTATPYYFDKDK